MFSKKYTHFATRIFRKMDDSLEVLCGIILRTGVGAPLSLPCVKGGGPQGRRD